MNFRPSKGGFLETNLTGQLVNSPIKTKIMQCDWLLSSVSIPMLDLIGQLLLGRFRNRALALDHFVCFHLEAVES
jgi:hypothetical protein